MRISDILTFNQERYFNGAIQAEWFYDPELSYEISSCYVFHGAKYFGVSDVDVQVGQHKLMDTISFASTLAGRVTGRNENGFVMTIAGYGTGKSHLAVTLGDLFSGHDERAQSAILENICRVGGKQGDDLRERIASTKNLVIALNGMNNFNLDHEVMECAKKALRQHDIHEDVLREITKAYATAEHFLLNSYAILEARYEHHARSSGLTSADSSLKEHLLRTLETSRASFDVVDAVYRELNGQSIQWEGGISAGEVLSFLCKRFVEEKGVFNRIIVLFDEFGRYIEYAAQNPGIAGDSALQQIFESVQNARGGIVHVAFIQSELSAYLSRIEKTSNISRYVGRYDTSVKFYLSSNFETILANLIQCKDESAFRQIVVQSINRTKQRQLLTMQTMNRWVKSSANKSVWSNDEMFLTVICKGCYPLHPITVWMLANMSNWMQQRSTITFASEMFDQISNCYLGGDRDFLPTIRPADIIESQVLHEMINSEEKGLVQSQYCLLYRDIITKFGDGLSKEERTVLNAILITNIGRFEAVDREDAILAVRHCACLSEDTVRRCLRTLEQTHGVVSYNDATGRFAMYAETSGRNDYKRVFLRHLIGAYKKIDINSIDEQISDAWGLNKPIETAFARMYGVSGFEWRYEKRLIACDDFSRVASAYASLVDTAFDGEQARGLLLLLYTNQPIEHVGADVLQICQHHHYQDKPIVVMILADPEKGLIDKLAEYHVLHAMTADERARFERFIQADQKSTVAKLVQQFEGMMLERNIVTKGGIRHNEKRLNQICNERFEACFPKPMPFNFDGFEKKLTPTIRRYINETASNLANGVLNRRGSYDLLQQDIKNRMRGLFSDAVTRSWRMLSSEFLFHMPMDNTVSDCFVSAKQIVDDQQPHNINELFAQYLLSPYGMNHYSLALLIVSFLSFYESSITIHSANERIGLPQLVQTVFTSSKLQFLTLIRFTVTAVSESSQNAVHEICATIKANRYVERCQELSNAMEQMLQAGDVNSEVDGDVASARMKTKEGLRLYRKIYEDLADAQNSAKELKTKFSFVKAIQVFVKLAKYEGAIEENSTFVYSDQYKEQCVACIDSTKSALDSIGMTSVPKIQCDITQLSQFTNTYKRVVDVLSQSGYPILAETIRERIDALKQNLLSTQKYKHSMDDVTYFLATSKLNSSSTRADCERIKEQTSNWVAYWSQAEDFADDQRRFYLNKLQDLSTLCEKKLSDMEAHYSSILNVETLMENEAGFARLNRMIDTQATFGLTDEQNVRLESMRNMIGKYEQFWGEHIIVRKNFGEVTQRALALFAAQPYKQFVLARLEKADQQLKREAKNWMQQNVLSYTRKIHNMLIADAMKLQRNLEMTPPCLDDADVDMVNDYRDLIAERIRLARVEAITIMFKELAADEKTRCLDDLRGIMGKTLKKNPPGQEALRNPSFTDDELVLLLYTYLKFKPEWFSARSLHINELSRLYRDLPIHSVDERLSPTFRNPAGIDLQIRSLAKCDPSDIHNQKLSPSVDMMRMWEEYADNPTNLEQRKDRVIATYGIDIKQYPTLFG